MNQLLNTTNMAEWVADSSVTRADFQEKMTDVYGPIQAGQMMRTFERQGYF